MRTALEMMNILVVACETEVRRKKREKVKTNNYVEFAVNCHWRATLLIFFI